MSKVTFVTATSGEAIALCPKCREVIGDVLLIATVPLATLPGDNTVPYTSMPTDRNVIFKPERHCICNQQPRPDRGEIYGISPIDVAMQMVDEASQMTYIASSELIPVLLDGINEIGPIGGRR